MRHRIATRAVAMALTVALGALLGGCASNVSRPAPSPACGTFHLDVSNGSSHPVLVRLDGEETLTLDAGASESLDGFGSSSVGPWHVELVDTESGMVIGSRDISVDDGPAGTLIKVDDDDAGAPAISGVTNGMGC